MAVKQSDNEAQSQRATRAKVICVFCDEKKVPDYKDFELIGRFVTDRGKIVSRSRSGVCAKHQRKLTKAVKRARHLALLPFVVRPR